MAGPSVFTLAVWGGDGWEYDSGPFPTKVQAAEQRTLVYRSGIAKGNVKIVPHAADEDIGAKIAHLRRFWLIERPELSRFSTPSYFTGWNELHGRPDFGAREDAVVFDNRKAAVAELRRVQRAEAELGHEGDPVPCLVFDDGSNDQRRSDRRGRVAPPRHESRRGSYKT